MNSIQLLKCLRFGGRVAAEVILVATQKKQHARAIKQYLQTIQTIP